MKRNIRYMLLPTLLLAVACGLNAQSPAPAISLDVSVEGGQTIKLTPADFAKLPRRAVHVRDHEGKDATFEGVELAEILKLAGVEFGEHMRGKAMALYLVAGAADNYRAIFALPELDHGFTDRVIIVADRRDGKPLSDKEGPLRIVVPDDKREARWVRQLNLLAVRRAP